MTKRIRHPRSAPVVYQNPFGQFFLFEGKTPRRVDKVTYKELVRLILSKEYLSANEKKDLVEILDIRNQQEKLAENLNQIKLETMAKQLGVKPSRKKKKTSGK